MTLSGAGIALLTAVIVVHISKNIFIDSKIGPYPKVVSMCVMLPFWLSVLLSGSWFAFAFYEIATSTYSLYFLKHTEDPKTQEILKEGGDAGLLGCTLIFMLPIIIAINAIVFACFQWLR